MAGPGEITQLLIAWGNGDQAALEKLISIVNEELHKLASSYMRQERSGHTLQTTALVNEAYIQLVDCRDINWRNRAHFFAIAAHLMETCQNLASAPDEKFPVISLFA